MKKIIIALLLVVTIVASIGLVACSDKGAQEAIDNYIFDKSGKTVTDDFILPLQVGGLDAEWSSSDSAITLEKRDEDWLAKVTLPDSGEVSVTLTLKLGKKTTKDFIVKVKAVDVYDIADNYVFAKDKATVAKNFDLERTATYKGKQATIDWSVDEAHKDYLAISEDGNTCVVTASTIKTEVKLTATFTYNGESTQYRYRMNVYVELLGLELVDFWYNNTDVSIDMSGYVVAIGTVYSTQYSNVTFYMVNDDFTAGYYIFRGKCDQATADKLVPGAHVTVTGSTNTNYNGLIETNAGGNVVVDEDIAAIDLSTTVKAIDELVIGDLPAAIHNQSRLVSLTNWVVKSVAQNAPEAGKSATLFTLTKGGVDVTIAVSKYVEGYYTATAGDAKYEAVCALRESVAVGNVVSVTGILGSYNNKHQIAVLDAADVKVGGTADAEGTVYVGQEVAKAVAAVNKAVADAGIVANKKLTEKVEFNLPESEGEVTMTYTVAEYSNAITMDGNKVTVTPGKAEKATIRVDYKKGDFETVQFIYIASDASAQVEPEPTPEGPVAISLAEFNALPDSVEDFYILEGTVESWYGKEENAKLYGNFNLTDGTTTVIVYGLCSSPMAYESNKWVNVKDFGTLGIDIGSTVKIVAAKGSYNGTPQAVGAGLYKEEQEEVSYEAKTLAEFAALADSNETFYLLEGTVESWYNADAPTKYGNFVLSDGTTTLVVYGLASAPMTLSEAGKWQNPQEFLTLGVELGDKIQIAAAKGSYNSVPQAVGSGLIKIVEKAQSVDPNPNPDPEPAELEAKTLAEFVALAVSNDTFYILEGTVVSWYNNETSAKQYGNFILSDGTTELIVYGLASEPMTLNGSSWSNPKDFNTLGVDIGSTVKIAAARGAFNTTPQAVGAYLLEKGDATDAQMVEIVLNGLKVAESATANFTLPTSDKANVEWTVKEGTAIALDGAEATVTRGAEDAVVVLTATVSKGEETLTKDFTVTVLAEVEIAAGTYTLNFVTNFATYADWNNSYAVRTIQSFDLGEGLPEMTVVLSNASKQTGTITDRPVLCAKNTVQYVTLTLTDEITSVTFDLAQWTTKNFADIHIEYSVDGENWVTCSDTITTPGELSSNVEFSAKYVRLSYVASSSSNTQMGLTAITVTVAGAEAPEADVEE